MIILKWLLEFVAQKMSFSNDNYGDFNAKSQRWYSQDKTSFERNTVDTITSTIWVISINKWAFSFIGNSFCIGPIFTSQLNLVVESDVYSSLHPICSHQIVLAKFNLMIFYPPPYSREVWHREANTDLIRRAISNFNLEKNL